MRETQSKSSPQPLLVAETRSGSPFVFYRSRGGVLVLDASFERWYESLEEAFLETLPMESNCFLSSRVLSKAELERLQLIRMTPREGERRTVH